MIDVIVLAGGRSTRMGGHDKAQVQLNGTRLIDVLTADILRAEWAGTVIAVSSHDLSVPGVRCVSEDPPFGGPVAGIAAGVDVLDGPAEYVAVLSVDAPASAATVPGLHAALLASPDGDVAAVQSRDGFLQPLCAVWRRGALEEALASLGEVRDVSARALLRGANVVEVPGDGAEADYDSVAELSELGDVEMGPKV
ncbi:molybdopterin-guanine dinucleotide biosynthesis protein A [Corynebacterium renale]|uniref:molybdenum cofactor guanylyltransferase n=1 Tax=Corynebacterium renale TaxID=1724 RepID=UPI000DA35F7F|nr:molybdenum cofactor guanylyltransferase [Corynebacterium renale]SQG63841.1 molybdopterin-guanine dinucleotide biosynthesis protein A [Corynebacterium renale]STD02377.1 molybdopterin-guanine dinucleotide biosynthesis protein A [Corynebacterium renale]